MLKIEISYENNGLQAYARKLPVCIQVWLMCTSIKTCLFTHKQNLKLKEASLESKLKSI